MSFFKCSLITVLLVHQITSQVVCSLDELVKELKEDILDNGKLDCLRKSATPNEANETEQQKIRRIKAEWNSDCSFEAEGNSNSHWLPKLMEIYGLEKGLVDAEGKQIEGYPQQKDFEDQADMCEIVRALIANGKIPKLGSDVTNIDISMVDEIDCPGSDGQTEVCAATGKSFADKKGWYILLGGKSITINGHPKYIPIK
jgi:hypothetical protein